MEDSTGPGTLSPQSAVESTQETSSQQTSLSEEVALSCMLCGLKANQLTSHVTRKHGMSTADYQSKFPGAKLVQLTAAQIQKMKETKGTKETKNKQHKKKMQARRDEIAGVDALRCEICGFESALSLISHITRKHNMLMADYRSFYPEALVQRCAPSQKAGLSEALKEKLEDEDEKRRFMEWRSYPSEIRHWTRKGFSESEAQSKVAEFQKNQSLKGNNDRTRALRSKMYSGENNPMSLQSLAKKNGISVSEAAKLTPCYGRIGSLHPMFGKNHTSESLAKIANAPHLSKPSFRSSGEIELENFCRSICSDIESNKRISQWNVDVVSWTKNVIIEFFGDFWHMNPVKYEPDDIHRLFKRPASSIWERDERKVKDLKSKGFIVIVVWERDWRFDRENQLQRIKDAFNSV